jgi:ABC-type sulfate transport system permease component
VNIDDYSNETQRREQTTKKKPENLAFYHGTVVLGKHSSVIRMIQFPGFLWNLKICGFFLSFLRSMSYLGILLLL